MARVDYRVARDGLAEYESPGHIDIMLTRRSFETESKWLTTMGAHRKTRELHRGSPQSSVITAMAVKKVVGGKRGRPRHLVIDNCEPSKTPLYAAAAGRLSLMGLFGLGPG
jgi:hypothetical protein